jgi:hypothetical protein
MHYVNWKKLLILILVATSSLGISSCETAPEMKNKPKLWGASSQYETLYRKEGKENYLYVSCKDPQFDNYICITKDDYAASEKELIDIANQCEKWK